MVSPEQSIIQEELDDLKACLAALPADLLASPAFDAYRARAAMLQDDELTFAEAPAVRRFKPRAVRRVHPDAVVSSVAGPPRVFIASPLRGDIARNQRYARIALKDSLDRGEAPFVPHLLYDQVLDDTVEAQRAQAIKAALAFLGGCDVLAVYTDLGISEGMRGEIERAKALGLQVVERSLGSLFREGAPVARCERCNWPLAASADEGCVSGNCSLREVRP